MSSVLTLPEPPLILIVDDEKVIRLQLRRAMESSGYGVIEASNGEQCLTAYMESRPDIILLDAVMPVMDGFTCCKKLQLLPGAEYTPILMITGLEDQESVDRAFEVGAIDYVTKPIHWPVLRQRVRRLLRESKLSRSLEQAYQELHQLAFLDSLTQVANRRRFDDYFGREWKRMARDQAPLALILCDIDYFKAYNDTYGHQSGDHCLQQVASAISMTIKRPADLVVRYGGEEFAVILPNTNTRGAWQVAEEIRTQVKALQINHTNSKVSPYVTLSAGAASMIPLYDDNPERLIAAADQALYQAKAQGRDRTVA